MQKIEMPKEGQLVRVNNRGAGDAYRRGGVAHPKGQVDHPHDRFNDKQLEALMGDPRLDVRIVDAQKKVPEKKE